MTSPKPTRWQDAAACRGMDHRALLSRAGRVRGHRPRHLQPLPGPARLPRARRDPARAIRRVGWHQRTAAAPAPGRASSYPHRYRGAGRLMSDLSIEQLRATPPHRRGRRPGRGSCLARCQHRRRPTLGRWLAGGCRSPGRAVPGHRLVAPLPWRADRVDGPPLQPRVGRHRRRRGLDLVRSSPGTSPSGSDNRRVRRP